jgi:hypothetical protein
MELRTNYRYPVSALLALAAAFAATPSLAMTAFDGLWSVNIASKTSACDVAYVVPIQVEDGNISYSGPFEATADGKVGRDGRLSVRLARDGDVVSATGSLTDSAGSGQWSGPGAECAGTWRARRV